MFDSYNPKLFGHAVYFQDDDSFNFISTNANFLFNTKRYNDRFSNGNASKRKVKMAIEFKFQIVCFLIIYESINRMNFQSTRVFFSLIYTKYMHIAYEAVWNGLYIIIINLKYSLTKKVWTFLFLTWNLSN